MLTERKQTVWDPLRKKNVTLTPEEEVRQWFIRTLHDVVKVPMHMMMSETGFKLGDKQFRADILIYGRDTHPIAVVECKRPNVKLDETVADQTLRYNLVLNVKYIFITNGNNTIVCKRKDNAFIPMTEAPTYEDMII